MKDRCVNLVLSITHFWSTFDQLEKKGREGNLKKRKGRKGGTRDTIVHKYTSLKYFDSKHNNFTSLNIEEIMYSSYT